MYICIPLHPQEGGALCEPLVATIVAEMHRRGCTCIGEDAYAWVWASGGHQHIIKESDEESADCHEVDPHEAITHVYVCMYVPAHHQGV